MIKNTCTHTEPVIREYLRAYWRNYYKRGRVLLLILLVLTLALPLYDLLVVGSGEYLMLLLAALPIAGLVLMYVKERRSIGTELARMTALYKGEAAQTMAELGGKTVKVKAQNGRVNEVKWADVLSWVETERLIVLLLRGGMTVPLAKDGFTQGSAEDCRERLRQSVTRQKRRRP